MTRVIDPEEIFEEQMRIARCCARIVNGSIVMSEKYFCEMLVRPAFGDSDSHYDRLCVILSELANSKSYEGGSQ